MRKLTSLRPPQNPNLFAPTGGNDFHDSNPYLVYLPCPRPYWRCSLYSCSLLALQLCVLISEMILPYLQQSQLLYRYLVRYSKTRKAKTQAWKAQIFLRYWEFPWDCYLQYGSVKTFEKTLYISIDATKIAAQLHCTLYKYFLEKAYQYPKIHRW